jgi:hypothetical protein
MKRDIEDMATEIAAAFIASGKHSGDTESGAVYYDSEIILKSIEIARSIRNAVDQQQREMETATLKRGAK